MLVKSDPVSLSAACVARINRNSTGRNVDRRDCGRLSVGRYLNCEGLYLCINRSENKRTAKRRRVRPSDDKHGSLVAETGVANLDEAAQVDLVRRCAGRG